MLGPLGFAKTGNDCHKANISFQFVTSKHLGQHLSTGVFKVFLINVLHKREEKMQEDENLVQVQQHYSDYFCVKTIFKS